MATREEIDAAQLTLSTVDAAARRMGHELSWRVGPRSTRRGCPYHLLGECPTCGASVMADAAGPASFGDRDAMKWRCR